VSGPSEWVFDRDEHSSQWAAITSIAMKVGVSSETLRKWVRTAEVDGGSRRGLTTEERERLKMLEREVRELRRANEILKSAAWYASLSTSKKTITCTFTEEALTRNSVRCRPPDRFEAVTRPKVGKSVQMSRFPHMDERTSAVTWE
jgi:transposase